jgi:hypothetical protein
MNTNNFGTAASGGSSTPINALANIKLCIFAGRVTEDQIKIVLGEHGNHLAPLYRRHCAARRDLRSRFVARSAEADSVSRQARPIDPKSSSTM